MNNLYQSPGHQQVVKELKEELKRLQAELGDDPDNVGDRPNLGDLAPGRSSSIKK